jgi:hypothetical protein
MFITRLEVDHYLWVKPAEISNEPRTQFSYITNGVLPVVMLVF